MNQIFRAGENKGTVSPFAKILAKEKQNLFYQNTFLILYPPFEKSTTRMYCHNHPTCLFDTYSPLPVYRVMSPLGTRLLLFD